MVLRFVHALCALWGLFFEETAYECFFFFWKCENAESFHEGRGIGYIVSAALTSLCLCKGRIKHAILTCVWLFRLLWLLVFSMYAVSDRVSVWLVFLHAIAGLLHVGVLLSPQEDERTVQHSCEFTHTHTAIRYERWVIYIEERLIRCCKVDARIHETAASCLLL